MRLFVCTLALAAAFAGPAAAADKLVPETAKGALEAHRGKPWRTPLFICAGFHTYDSGRLNDEGDAAGSWNAMRRGVEFKDAGARQLVQDQGVSAEVAAATATRLTKNHATGIGMAIQGDTFIADWRKACDEIWTGYKKAGG